MSEQHALLIDQYLYLTKSVLPELARKPSTQWPVVNDHCFQRIVLDNICNGVWYNYINKPAYRNLSYEQAYEAVQLSESIAKGEADLHQLNHNSLVWREKR